MLASTHSCGRLISGQGRRVLSMVRAEVYSCWRGGQGSGWYGRGVGIWVLYKLGESGFLKDAARAEGENISCLKWT